MLHFGSYSQQFPLTVGLCLGREFCLFSFEDDPPSPDYQTLRIS